MWFLSRFRLNLLKNHVPFENSAREGGFPQITFSNHHFQIWLFRADLKKERGFWVNFGLISSKTTFLLRIPAHEGGFLKSLSQITIFKFDFSEPISKTNVVVEYFWVDLGLIAWSLQEPYIYHILFDNSGFLKSPFSNLTFQSRFPKRMWILNRFRLNLLKNHVPFENSAREVVFSNHCLKSPFSNLTFQSRFPKRMCFLE